MLDMQRFQQLWQRLGGHDGVRVFAALADAYAEPHRAYHNTRHLEDCLRRFDSARALADEPDVVEMALWFHDAIYDARAKDNEERSARWARRELLQDGIPADTAEHVVRLILLTRHNAEPDSRDGELLLDVDLSILSSDPETFAEYDQNIRREYAWVADDVYRQGRRAVLEGFLKRTRIFRTEAFADLEESARRNLADAIGRLN